jgi:hypothetical protein
MMDHFIYSNSSTDSGVSYMNDPLQPLKAGLPNVTNLSAGATSTVLTSDGSTSVTFSAVDAVGSAGKPATEAVSRFEIGGTVMSGMRNFGVEMGRNPRAYHLYQGNCHNVDSFGPGQKFDCSAGLLKPQINYYSGGDYRPQQQRYLHGANPTPILLSGDARSNEHVEGTQLLLQERTAQAELFYDQTLGAFNRVKVGRPIRGSAVGRDSIPATGSINTELALQRNQNFVAQKFVQHSKYDENLSPVSCIGGMNMRAEGDQTLSFEKCMPNIKCHDASGNVAANTYNATSWKGKWNVGTESSPALDWQTAVLMNYKKIDVPISSFGGKPEVLPKSDMGSTLPAPVDRSGVFNINAATGIQHHRSNFNKAPGSAVGTAGRYCYVNQPSNMLEDPPCMKYF